MTANASKQGAVTTFSALTLVWHLCCVALCCTLPFHAAHSENHAGVNTPAAFIHSNRLDFTNYTVADGLPDNNVTSIAQDKIGFMWFGTRYGGLSRFDGHSFRTFSHDPEDPASLSFDWIWELYRDNTGNLWIGTNGGGLNRYDADTESFVRYEVDKNNPAAIPDDNIKSFLEDAQGRLWIGSNAGLSLYEPASDSFTTLAHDPDNPNSPAGPSIRALMLEPDSGRIWLGTRRNGVSIYDPAGQTFTHLRHDARDPESLSHPAVTNIFRDASGTIWVATRRGLNRYDKTTGKFTRFLRDPSNETSIDGSHITQVLQDRKDRFWVGSLEALNLLDRDTTDFSSARQSALYGSNPRLVDDVNVLFEDAAGNLWVGSRSSGVSLLHADVPTFLFTQSLTLSDDRRLGASSASALHFDRQSRLWAGGRLSALNYFQGDDQAFFVPPAEHSAEWQIQAIHQDKADAIWIGTQDGALSYQEDTFRTFKHNPDNPGSISGNSVFAIAGDAEAGTWFAVDGEGIDYYDGQTFERFSYQRDDPSGMPTRYPKSLLADSAGQAVWVGTNNAGLLHVDRATRRIERFLPNPDDPEDEVNNYVRHIARDGDGILWLATNNGVYEFDPQTRSFGRHITKSEGLISNTTMAVHADVAGNLWIASLTGLSRYDLGTGVIRQFDLASELRGGTMLARAVTQGADGIMYWGTGRGILSFRPQDADRQMTLPAIVVTDLQFDGDSVAVSPQGGALTRSATLTDVVEIPAGQRRFSFVLATLGFHPEGLVRYRFKLEGHDQNWQVAPAERRFVTYSKVDPGQYVFLANALGPDGDWLPEGITKTVNVLPHWWQSTWFQWSWPLILLGAVIAAFGVQHRLAQSFRELAMFPAQSPHPVMRFDKQNRLTYINAASGFLRDWYDLAIGRPAPSEWQDHLETVRQARRPEELDVHRQGEDRHAAFTFSPLQDSDHVNVYGRETTEQKSLERQLIQAHKTEAIGQLTRGVAHDFNNILAVIQANLENSLLSDGLSDDVGNDLRSSIDAVNRGAGLTHRLLAFSRQQPLTLEAVDLNEQITGLEDMLTRSLGAQVSVEKDLSEDLWRCVADVSQLENAIVNLAINARDAMPSGGHLILKTRNIELNSSAFPEEDVALEGRYVLLEVKDSGQGISADNLKRIFDPFFTTKDVGKGTGLGLSMVYGFARQSLGHLAVKSDVGKGTTFSLYLPSAERVPVQEGKASEPRDEIYGGGRVVLVVEDDLEIRQPVEKVLKDFGYVVRGARTAQEALDIVDAESVPNLLLTDIVLPEGMSGLELAQSLKGRHPSLGVVFMSGYFPEAGQPGEMMQERSRVLQKPFSFDELLGALANAFDKQDAAPRNRGHQRHDVLPD